MITLHNFIVRYNDRFHRWYGYTDSGLLVYFDFSLCPDSDKLVSGSSYKITGKIMPSPKTGEGCPIFILMCINYAEV